MTEISENMPVSSYELIDILDRLYPHQCIKPGQSFAEAHREAGARQLVDDLLTWREETLRGSD